MTFTKVFPQLFLIHYKNYQIQKLKCHKSFHYLKVYSIEK